MYQALATMKIFKLIQLHLIQLKIIIYPRAFQFVQRTTLSILGSRINSFIDFYNKKNMKYGHLYPSRHNLTKKKGIIQINKIIGKMAY